MNRIRGTGEPKIPGEPELFPKSGIAAQQRSKGGALKGMSLGDIFFYFILFGWIWGFEPSAQKTRIIGNIRDKGVPDEIIPILKTLSLTQVEAIQQVLENPYAQAHLKAANSRDLKGILEKFAANPDNALQVFQNFENAQLLLNGRISEDAAFHINSFFLQQPDEVQKKMKEFLEEAIRLENMKPEGFPLVPSDETNRLTNEMRANLVFEDKLVTNLIQEIEFITTVGNTQIIVEAVESMYQDQPRTGSTFKNHYNSPAPFALLFATETTENSIIISVSDPRTKEVRRAEIEIPPREGLPPEELHKWLVNPISSPLAEEKLMAAEAFQNRAHETLARLIYRFKIPLRFKGGGFNKGRYYEFAKQGNIYSINHQNETYLSLYPFPAPGYTEWATFYSDRSLIIAAKEAILSEKEKTIKININDSTYADEITVTPKSDEMGVTVTYTYKGKTHQCRYLYQEGEGIDGLADRISLDRTLERDLLLMKADFTRQLNLE